MLWRSWSSRKRNECSKLRAFCAQCCPFNSIAISSALGLSFLPIVLLSSVSGSHAPPGMLLLLCSHDHSRVRHSRTLQNGSAFEDLDLLAIRQGGRDYISRTSLNAPVQGQLHHSLRGFEHPVSSELSEDALEAGSWEDGWVTFANMATGVKRVIAKEEWLETRTAARS